MGKPRALCRHCHKGPANRPRGLCSRCHGDRVVRVLYPTSAHKGARRSREDFYGFAPPPEPTGARPGTVDKFIELAARADAGLELFHPRDAVLDLD